LARATTPEERWQVVWDAGQWFEDMEDQQQARERYQESLAEAAQMPASPQSDVHLLDSRIALIRLSETDAAPAYAALLPVLRALPALERWRLADVLEALNSLESRAQADVRIARLREALQARQDADSPDAFRLTEDRVELARLIDADGDADGAEALLRSNLADTTNRPSAIAVRQLEPLAWFLMAHGRAAEAESLLAARSSSTPASQAVRQALAWSCLLQGKTAVARELLQEELAALKTQKSSAWQRLSITLDLIHASADVSQESARWIAEASELRVTASQQLRGFRAFLAHEAENKDWENVRGPARLAALQRLPATADELADNRGGVK
jgi:hypothetical protein